MVKMPHQLLRRTLFLLLAVASGLTASGQAQAEPPAASVLVPETGNAEALAESLRLKWEMEGIDAAIRSGFLAVAETLTGRLLERSDLSPGIRESVLNARLHIALVQGDTSLARATVNTLEGLGLEANPLTRAFLEYFDGEYAAAEAMLDSLALEDLSVEDEAWSLLLRGLILNRRGETEAAFETIQASEERVPDPLLKEQFEIIRYREELALGSSDETTISALRESVRSMAGERGGFEAARLLAVALYNSGDPAAAIGFDPRWPRFEGNRRQRGRSGPAIPRSQHGGPVHYLRCRTGRFPRRSPELAGGGSPAPALRSPAGLPSLFSIS
jgi:hypothetical protein